MNQKDLEQFFEIVQLIVQEEQEIPVSKPVNIEELHSLLDLKLEDEPVSDEIFFGSFKELVKHTPKTASKSFFNQLIGGRRSRAVLGDLVSSILNNSTYTYKVVGPMVAVEKGIIKKIADLLGYPASYSGTIASGGSISNFMAMVLGRDAKANTIEDGINHPMIFYTSEACHYSVAKNASLMGIGRKQVRFISTNEVGEMDMALLEAQIIADYAQNKLPFSSMSPQEQQFSEHSTTSKKHRLFAKRTNFGFM